MNKVLLIATAVIALSAGTAQAQDVGNWTSFFVKVGAGWNHNGDQHIQDGPALSADVGIDEGYALSASIGTHVGAFRPEIEISRRTNDVDSITVNGLEATTVGGSMTSIALMVNAFFDIPTGTILQPYIGAGIGMARVEMDNYSIIGVTVADDTDDVLAWQAIVGADYQYDPEFSLFAEYKYFATSDIDFTTTAGNAGSENYRNHSILAGIKYNFR